MDWFRNIQHNSNVLVQSGARRLEAVAQRLPLELAAGELRDYAQRHSLSHDREAAAWPGTEWQRREGAHA